MSMLSVVIKLLGDVAAVVDGVVVAGVADAAVKFKLIETRCLYSVFVVVVVVVVVVVARCAVATMAADALMPGFVIQGVFVVSVVDLILAVALAIQLFFSLVLLVIFDGVSYCGCCCCWCGCRWCWLLQCWRWQYDLKVGSHYY